MKPCIMYLSCLLPVASALVGCASDVTTDDANTDSDLGPAAAATARLSSVWYNALPDTRPYQLDGVLGGELRVRGTYQGDSWALSFAPGVQTTATNAQVIASSLTTTGGSSLLDIYWSTHDFGLAAAAGAAPDSDDIYTLLLSAQSAGQEGTPSETAIDAVQLRLDNTLPISRVTRLCRDLEGTDCFGFTANPSDVGATNSPNDIFQVSTSETTKLYVFGVALDKTFTGYSVRMVGGQNSTEQYLCWATTDNSACVGSAAQAAQSFGYGTARDLNYQPTLAESGMVDAYSDDTLLMIWDISYLTPDAYGLNLNVTSNSYEDNNDDATATSCWVTLVISA